MKKTILGSMFSLALLTGLNANAGRVMVWNQATSPVVDSKGENIDYSLMSNITEYGDIGLTHFSFQNARFDSNNEKRIILTGYNEKRSAGVRTPNTSILKIISTSVAIHFPTFEKAHEFMTDFESKVILRLYVPLTADCKEVPFGDLTYAALGKSYSGKSVDIYSKESSLTCEVSSKQIRYTTLIYSN